MVLLGDIEDDLLLRESYLLPLDLVEQVFYAIFELIGGQWIPIVHQFGVHAWKARRLVDYSVA